MAVKKNKVAKLKSEKLKELLNSEKKLKDLMAFGTPEKAAVRGLDLLILAADCLAGFYGGRRVSDLKTAAQVLFLINSPESKNFVRQFIEIESLKRQTELSGRPFGPAESEKISTTVENFSNWVKTMIPDFSEGFEF